MMGFSLLFTFLLRAFFVLGATMIVRRLLLDRLPASSRYLLVFCSLAFLPLLAFAPTFASLPPIHLGFGKAAALASSQSVEEGFVFSGSLAGARDGRIHISEGLATTLFVVWAVLFLFFLARALALRVASARSVWRLAPCSDPDWFIALERAKAKLGFSGGVSLYSGPFRSPFVAGGIGKAIVLPEDLSSWTQDRREAVMLHELGHIKRHDLWLMTLSEAFAASVWPIPFVPHLLRCLVEDREEACDALAIEAGARPLEYASMILDLASARQLRSVPGAQGATDGSRAGQRIRRIVEGGLAFVEEGSGLCRKVAGALLILSVAISAAFPSVFATEGRADGNLVLHYISRDGSYLSGAFPEADLPQGNPLDGAWAVSLAFGPAQNPFTGKAYLHNGIDLTNSKMGDDVRATMSGQVIRAGFEKDKGNYVVIGRGDTIVLFYHLESLAVAAGETVQKGRIIGRVGTSGQSTGPHLHYEVHVGGLSVDPAGILARYSIDLRQPGRG
jgi:murein DD-endopeptidase MepM/ murein hydrolase activator NlpD/Zn-dependent protease with chaperone function